MPIVDPVISAVTAMFSGDRQSPTASRNDPLAWLYRLEGQLHAENVGRAILRNDGTYEWRHGLPALDAYYSGDHPLPEVKDPETRTRYLEFMRRSRTNYMQPVIDAERQRLHWQGVRIGSDRDATPDSATWDIMEQNGVDAAFSIAVQTALVQRRSYFSVWYAGPGRKNKTPVIRLEDPTQTIVEYEAGDRTKRAAALKLWVDDWDGGKLANVYLPNFTYKYRWHDGDSFRPSGWYEREPSVRNPLGVVPIIPLVNRPTVRLDPDGRSELDSLIPMQSRINQTALNAQVAEHFSAFRQKWATGMAVATDPKTGKPVSEFKAAIDSFWQNSNELGKWGEFQATDLANYEGAKSGAVQDIAIISATPRHYFTVNGQAPSGDSMRSAESSLVAKCVDFQRGSGNPTLKEVTSLAREIAGMDRAEVHPIWSDPEYQTLGQLVDGQVKLVASEIVSLPYAREQIGMSPAAMERVDQEVRAERAERVAAAKLLASAAAATAAANKSNTPEPDATLGE